MIGNHLNVGKVLVKYGSVSWSKRYYFDCFSGHLNVASILCAVSYRPLRMNYFNKAVRLAQAGNAAVIKGTGSGTGLPEIASKH